MNTLEWLLVCVAGAVLIASCTQDAAAHPGHGNAAPIHSHAAPHAQQAKKAIQQPTKPRQSKGKQS